MSTKIKNIKSSTSSRRSHKPKGVSSREFQKVHWPYLPILLIIFVMLSVGFQGGALQAAIKHPAGKVLDYATSMSVSGLLSSTNSARSSNGVVGLSLNSKLNAAAVAKANDMASRNYWSHYTPEGNPPWVFVSAEGYSYQKLGENLAAGFNSEQAVINGWLGSAPHRENLLNSSFSEVGFGFANNPNYTSAGGGPMTIVVAFYGLPQDAGAPAVKQNAAPSPPARAAAPTPTPPPQQTAPPPTPAVPPPQPKEPPVGPISEKEPVTTESQNHGVTLSLRTSRAQLAFAKLPVSNFATGIAIFGVVASVGFWIGRHALALRKVFVRGESFAIKHPLMDVVLFMLAALSFLLTQTAGFII